MIAGLLRGMRLRAAAKQYARRLGPQLVRDYGAGATYTAQQIRQSAVRAGLRGDCIAFGYAAFMDEAGFAALGAQEIGLGYEELRAMMLEYAGRSASAGFMPLPENSDAFAGASVSMRDQTV